MAEQKARRAPGGPTDRPATFPANVRILTGGEFASVFRKNTRSKDACFTVLVHNASRPEARLGMAIARKSAGNAVQRNRIKRLVRETFRQTRQSLPPADFVVLAKPGVAQRTNDALLHSLAGHWSRFAITEKKEKL